MNLYQKRKKYQHLHSFDVYSLRAKSTKYFLLFFIPGTDTEQNSSYLGNRLRLTRHLILWSENGLRSKFSCAQIWEKGCWGAKIAKDICFLANGQTILSYITYLKISLLCQLGEEIWGERFFLFWPWKKCCYTPIFLPNWIRSWNLICRLVGRRRCDFLGV